MAMAQPTCIPSTTLQMHDATSLFFFFTSLKNLSTAVTGEDSIKQPKALGFKLKEKHSNIQFSDTDII